MQRSTVTVTRNKTDNMRINTTKITRKQKWEEKQLYGNFNQESVLENEMHKHLWDFETQIDHPISATWPDQVIVNNKKERTCPIVDFVFPADHWVRLKENEKKDKYLDLARKLKKLWNMKVTVTPIVVGVFSAVTKGLIKGLEDLEIKGWVETLQTAAILKSARILRRVLETWGDLLSLEH